MEEIVIPTLHPGQAEAYSKRGRFNVLRCGRRYGKTQLLQAIAANRAIKGGNVFWGTPDYKIQSEAYAEILDILNPIVASSSKTDGVIKTITGGRIDFWSLENERAGRSRKYHDAIIDEAAFTKPNMMRIWETAIKPSLLDYTGRCWVASTPNGVDPDNFFWKICNEPEHEFVEFHAPTRLNPYLPANEIEKLEKSNHPLVFQQEYLAEFVDWSGAAFFSIDKLLDDGQPVPFPTICDGVYAVIDTAVKDGREHDGTAVIYFSVSNLVGHKLVILDYDKIQIEGAMLETWLPTVYSRIEQLSKECKARYGGLTVYIEDKASGSILLQQAKLRGWSATPIDSQLTAFGKDERAISVSGIFHQGQVKISQYAFDKVINFKGATRNHLLTEVTTFRIGDKEAYKRADDLLDCFTYGISLGAGNKYGY